MIRVRRQTVGEIDAPAIEELTAGCDSDEHGRVTVLGDANDCCMLHWRFHHVPLLSTPGIEPYTRHPLPRIFCNVDSSASSISARPQAVIYLDHLDLMASAARKPLTFAAVHG